MSSNRMKDAVDTLYPKGPQQRPATRAELRRAAIKVFLLLKWRKFCLRFKELFGVAVAVFCSGSFVMFPVVVWSLIWLWAAKKIGVLPGIFQ